MSLGKAVAPCSFACQSRIFSRSCEIARRDEKREDKMVSARSVFCFYINTFASVIALCFYIKLRTRLHRLS